MYCTFSFAFIAGKDDSSKEIVQNLESAEVSSRLESDKFVAIKIQSDTENYKFFAQICMYCLTLLSFIEDCILSFDHTIDRSFSSCTINFFHQ